MPNYISNQIREDLHNTSINHLGLVHIVQFCCSVARRSLVRCKRAIAAAWRIFTDHSTQSVSVWSYKAISVSYQYPWKFADIRNYLSTYTYPHTSVWQTTYSLKSYIRWRHPFNSLQKHFETLSILLVWFSHWFSVVELFRSPIHRLGTVSCLTWHQQYLSLTTECLLVIESCSEHLSNHSHRL